MAGRTRGADIPDLDSLHADACWPGYSYDMNQRLQLESKERMRARGIRSPDEWDAVVLTFAEPVRDPAPRRVERDEPRREGGPLSFSTSRNSSSEDRSGMAS
jgi:hypothetical protein